MSKRVLTPLMQSYLDMKASLPEESILLCRLGDFYELFFEDAIKGAKILEISLTQRHGIDMAGIPYHALDNYLPKLLHAGIKVAIAEQIEDPKDVKSRLVKREIVKIITPGSITQDSVLDARKGNYFACIYNIKGQYGIAFLDISTGDFLIIQVASIQELYSELTRLNPQECLISQKQIKIFDEDQEYFQGITLSSTQQYFFDEAQFFLCQHFSVQNLTSLGCQDFESASIAAGALLRHVKESLLNKVSHVLKLRICHPKDFMVLDDTSQHNLELVESLYKQQNSQTLLSILDYCTTVMGSRLLREWILRPLKNKEDIIARQKSIQTFIHNTVSLEELLETLGGIRDIQRIITRVGMGSANARDLLNLKNALSLLPIIHTIFSYMENISPVITKLLNELKPLPELVELLEKSLAEGCPLSLREGDIIKENYNEDLDKLRAAAQNGNSLLRNFEEKQRQETGIKSLKVRYNKNFGYFVELSKSVNIELPEHYIRRQTLTNAERYTTEKLREIENLILGASEKSKRLEFNIFQDIREQSLTYLQDILKICQVIAQLDCLCSLSRVALYNNYTCPIISDEKVFKVVGGRHPIGEKINEGNFISNDTSLSDGAHFHLITGPNMAGKSTYIRQVALLSIMTQMGSFIPAESAEIGIFDAVFTRIGASDNLAKGQSTFMVEMSETAHILNNCTPNSLIILDEIGRGTSTYDGLSLAWSITETLHKKGVFTLFATHYHELTNLSKDLSGFKNFNVAVKENQGSIFFLYKIVSGAANQSYGIQVASIAGIPQAVLQRANAILKDLESNDNTVAVDAMHRGLFD